MLNKMKKFALKLPFNYLNNIDLIKVIHIQHNTLNKVIT